MAVVGLGLGVTLATAASGALAELPQERSGVGSAVMQALQKIGGPLGAAILGSVLSSAYQAQLSLAGLPPAGGERGARRASSAAWRWRAQLGSAGACSASVRAASSHGMDALAEVARRHRRRRASCWRWCSCPSRRRAADAYPLAARTPRRSAGAAPRQAGAVVTAGDDRVELRV